MIQNQLSRRNITEAKQVVLNLILEPLLAAQAKVRMTEGRNQHSSPVVNSPQGSEHRAPTTRDQIGAASGVCGQTVSRVKKVMTDGDDETKQKMLAGDLAREFRKPPDLADNTHSRGRTDQQRKSTSR